MGQELVLLLHGFASSGNSGKAQFLREKFKAMPDVPFHPFDFNPTPTDFEYVTVTGMINRVRQYLLDRGREQVLLIGSSMGALVGLHYAHRFGGVRRMLLLAPALAFGGPLEERVFHFGFQKEIRLRQDLNRDGALYKQPVPPSVPVTIIHGRHDDVVPIAYSRQYASQFPERVVLLEVESDHRLSDQMDFVWEQLRVLLGQ
jgi:pimeloyl-ACP methyl ester carboxylesterase